MNPAEAIQALCSLCARTEGKDWDQATKEEATRLLLVLGRETPCFAGSGRYACPECGSLLVQLCFPVWVRANDLDNRQLWELDTEASPEKDSDKGWCIECQSHILVRVNPERGNR